MSVSLQKFLANIANYFFRNTIKHDESSLEMFRTAVEEMPIPSATALSRMKQNKKEGHNFKKSIFSEALKTGVATLYLDPRVEGVKVPDRFKGNDMLVLNYSYGYNLEDFQFDDVCVIASLSFNRQPFQCVVPWEAVFGIGNMTDGAYYSFTENDPNLRNVNTAKNPLTAIKKSAMIESDSESDTRALERRKQFRLIKGGES